MDDRENPEELMEMHAIFRGTVQGVGFRWQTKQFALELNLRGTVKNLPDGSVEVDAQGSKKALTSLVSCLENSFHLETKSPYSLTFKKPKEKWRDEFIIIHER